MKKIVSLLMCALLVLSCACASAVTLEGVELGARDFEYEAETRYLITRSKEWTYGIATTAGEVLAPCSFGALYYAGHGYFEAINDEGVNCHALVNERGEVVIDYLYAAFEMLSDRWCVAVTLEETDGEVYDYSGGFMGGGEHYLITTCDVYDLYAGAKVGTLTRDQYDSCRAHGAYLYVEDRNGDLCVYDEKLQPVECEAEYLHASFGVEGGKAVNLSNGAAYGEDVTNVSDQYEEGCVVVWTRAGVGMIDYDGNQLIPYQYDSIGSIHDGYVPVEKDDLYGLYDIAGNKEVVPCLYDEIPWFGLGTVTRYVFNGYAAVVKDGKVGFVDMNGNVTCEPKYAESGVTYHGCCITVPDIDGSIYIVAADGTQTKTDLTEVYEHSGGDGSILIAARGEQYGMVDWHGQEVLPFEYAKYDLEITDYADAVIVDGALMVVK